METKTNNNGIGHLLYVGYLVVLFAFCLFALFYVQSRNNEMKEIDKMNIEQCSSKGYNEVLESNSYRLFDRVTCANVSSDGWVTSVETFLRKRD